jgi:multiple sugar transport system substrate-binding protein
MHGRDLTPHDAHRRRDDAIVDLAHGLISRREFMRRMTAAGVSAVFAARVADALASPRPVTTPSRWERQADATVTMTKGPHHPDDPKFWADLKTQFEATHPGIALNVIFFDWAAMDAQLAAFYAADSPPDVVYLVDLVLAKYVRAGQVADISAQTSAPSYAAEKAGIAPFAWRTSWIDGAQRGVGVLGAAFGLFYNVDLLTKAGILEFPQTRDVFLDVAKTLTRNGVFGIQFQDLFVNYAQWDWFPYVHNDGADILTPDLRAQALDPGAASATQWLADLRLAHQVAPAAGLYDPATSRAMFAAGRIAILHDQFPQAAAWELDPTEKLPFAFDVAPVPATAAGGTQTVAGNFGYATISEKSPVKDAAWEFVKWWASAEVVNPYAAKVGLQSVRIDSTPPYQSAHLQRIQADLVPKVQGVQMHVNYWEMLTTLWPEIERANRGEQSGAEAMRKAGAIVTSLLTS